MNYPPDPRFKIATIGTRVAKQRSVFESGFRLEKPKDFSETEEDLILEGAIKICTSSDGNLLTTRIWTGDDNYADTVAMGLLVKGRHCA